ncbi:CapA family protein [candidate division KSB1 bacterium]|nr:CapA family protein [candidate division KSB1 bacterium]
MQIGFVGDTSFTGTFRERLLSGEDVLSAGLQDLLRANDFNVCNFEGPATEASNILRTDLRVVSPPQSVMYLFDCNFNIFNLANNHVFDCGEAGFSDTIREIQKSGARYFGAGQNIDEASKVLYVEGNDIHVALIGFAHKEGMIASKDRPGVFCETDRELLNQRICEAKANADWVVVNYHGGEEFTLFPMPRRRRFLHDLSALGVDVIIAHHAHVFQGVEKIQNTTLFYSLGNFMFDVPILRARSHTAQSGMAVLQFQKDLYKYKIHSLRIDYERGCVETVEDFDPSLEHLSDFSIYPKTWRRDAARVIRESRKPIHSYSGAAAISPSVSKSRKLRKLKKVIKEITGLFTNPIKRSLYSAALRYMMMDRLFSSNTKNHSGESC